MQVKEGQVWTYDNRQIEPDSKAIILKAEDMKVAESERSPYLLVKPLNSWMKTLIANSL